MTSILTSCMNLNFHSMVPFCSPGGAIRMEARRSSPDVRTPRPRPLTYHCMPLLPIARHVELSSPCNSSQLRNPLPPIDEISPPSVKHRDLQMDLMPAVGHLGRNQPDRSPNPLDVLLPIKRRQHQVPDPERQIVGQLGAKQIAQLLINPSMGR